MQYLKDYLSKLSNRGNIKLAESVNRTATDVGVQHLASFSFTTHETGLLFGNVQSGKTAQVFAIICKATDMGFPVFLFLTTDNIVLYQQTIDRIQADLAGYCICGENDSGRFIENMLIDPVIVVLKKNARILKLWANVFNSTGFMKGNPLFIIDDEADAASLNTLVNRNGKSTINKLLDTIKNGASSSLYLQVTGTPQAIFLQSFISGWHPCFTYYFRPGENYLGGDFFFKTDGIPRCIRLNEHTGNPLREVVIRHLAVSSHILANGGGVSNCLLHPSVSQNVHLRFADEVKANLDWCRDNFSGGFRDALVTEYASIASQNYDIIPFEDIYSTAGSLLETSKSKVIIMNGKHDVDLSEYASGCNFIIGGNALSRGVTFPRLQTIYYARTNKHPQADTMWQHSRMFGYDREPGLMKVYIDERLYKLFSDINSTNNSIIAQIENGIEQSKIFYPSELNPTRKNVLDRSRLETVSGGTNYYPLDPDNDTIEDITRILSPFSEAEPYYQVSLRLILEILSHIVPSKDYKQRLFTAYIKAILSEQSFGQGYLLVRRNRDVAQGTGALLSPNDWSLGNQFTQDVVLTMYQVTGKKGWGGRRLWIPNIKLPERMVIYDVLE